MRPPTAWICFVVSMAACNLMNADPVRRFLDSLNPAQLGTCYHQSEYLVLDTWPDRSPRTIAAEVLVDSECNSVLSLFRVGRNGQIHRVAIDPGSVHRMELFDVTGNGVPEILVTRRPGNRSAAVDILKWDGVALKRIGETADYAAFVDVNHDGALEIVERLEGDRNDCWATGGRAFLQRLVKGRYVSVHNPALAAVVVVSKTKAGAETFVTKPFLSEPQARRYRVRIVNGTHGAKHRASEVRLAVRRVSGDREDPTPGASSRCTRPQPMNMSTAPWSCRRRVRCST